MNTIVTKKEKLEKIKILKEHLDEKRYEHVKRVVKKARQLAKIHNAPIDKSWDGCLFTWCSKIFWNEPHVAKIIGEKYEEVTDIAYQTSELLHGFAGAEYVKEKFKITDEEILDAIRYHTIGKKNVGLVSKMVYVQMQLRIKETGQELNMPENLLLKI